MDMTAVVCHGPKDYRIETIRRPEPKDKELLVRVGACGICASDRKCWSGAGMFWDIPWVKAPVVAGHEFFGFVEAAGPGAEEHHGVAVGDMVIAEQIVPCGTCRYCRDGQYWMCERHDIFGFQRGVADGGMAEYMIYPANARVHKMPADLPLEDAAIVEPLACAIHAVERGTIGFRDVVVIAGTGPIGLFMVQVAALLTPKTLVAVDLSDERLALAKRYGADVCINPSRDDAIQVVKDLTDGYGCDVYIEASGAPAGVTQGLQMVRKLGRFVEFSVFGKETSADWSIIGDRKELDIRGAHLGPRAYEVAIDLLARGKVTSDGIVTDTYALGDWEAAFERSATMEAVKVLLVPGTA
ncbi:alcohol dehydrogenase catalytic domain-containing protein [Roseospira visakhapatnamensis]|uniref:L-iditol 2-dehydrogenase n=1 Tax=Roseospira visakhapatnamensis TaxID=390880 RepID=A0A7W6RE20_9PROT|nr:alcohol dehydrogenase catalytic domain-containing protein [Roseospira visakhapatnamensis]MBB4266753.1 L-iditol 2-dehydrogenase [Roseospira visakhapatnamensis]